MLEFRWKYFLALGQVDVESDNWNIHAQFNDDPTFTWNRMKQ